MLGDVSKAERALIFIFNKPIVQELLKRSQQTEEANYTAEGIIRKLGKNLQVKVRYGSILSTPLLMNKILSMQGIVYLLSTRPHTNSNSNFVKLVRNKVVENDNLIKYLQWEKSDYDPKPVKDSLIRYLKLTKTAGDD
ncbi:MAG: hypothetical protein Q4D57_02970 [Clostridia bacterium]|nr:hypothetical protein [Clostridia bacterium]